MSTIDNLADVKSSIDAFAVYLRDSVIKGDKNGVIKAETQLKRCEVDLEILRGGF
jgi:hypothetical protein